MFCGYHDIVDDKQLKRKETAIHVMVVLDTVNGIAKKANFSDNFGIY